jgi:hypothetical protein
MVIYELKSKVITLLYASSVGILPFMHELLVISLFQLRVLELGRITKPIFIFCLHLPRLLLDLKHVYKPEVVSFFQLLLLTHVNFFQDRCGHQRLVDHELFVHHTHVDVVAVSLRVA